MTFKREERYIVVKLKDLTPMQEQDLRALLAWKKIPTRESLVIEPDWPEYEETWASIEGRCS